jgi:nicotinamidase-related amidase
MAQFHLDPKTCALIVVDVQVDFCSPTGSTAKRGKPNTKMQALPAKINSFVKEIEGLGVLFVYVKSVVYEEHLAPNVRFFNQMKGIKPPTQAGTDGAELYDLYIPQGSIIISKETVEPFTATNLKQILEEKGISSVLICGVRTEICVDGTARKAFAEGYNVLVISDLVATRDNNADDEQYALRFIDAYTGFVMSSDQVKAVLGYLRL